MKEFLGLIARCFLIIPFVITSCGYFDHDGIEIQEPVVGNIMVQKQRGSLETSLVLKETEQVYSVLVEDCDSVFYDPNKMLIWVKNIINGYNSNYYQLKILDTSETNEIKTIQKKEIFKHSFMTNTNQKIAKWTRKKGH